MASTADDTTKATYLEPSGTLLPSLQLGLLETRAPRGNLTARRFASTCGTQKTTNIEVDERRSSIGKKCPMQRHTKAWQRQPPLSVPFSRKHFMRHVQLLHRKTREPSMGGGGEGDGCYIKRALQVKVARWQRQPSTTVSVNLFVLASRAEWLMFPKEG